MTDVNKWPAEPWVNNGNGEIHQDGGLTPIVQVDSLHTAPKIAVDATADRIVACVNALAGVADPSKFLAGIRSLADLDPRHGDDKEKPA